MGGEHENQSQGFDLMLQMTNYVFSSVFLVEAVLKLTAFGKTYFNNSWNRFDFFVVVSSIFDLMLELMESNSLEILSVGP